jgi:hypothetical protein
MSESGSGQRRGHIGFVKKAALAAAALLLPSVASAQLLDGTMFGTQQVAPSVAPALSDSASVNLSDFGDAQSSDKPLYLDDATAPAAPVEQPNVHGFFSSPFKTAYVTPRGLVVQNEGVVWQPVIGLVFPVGDLGPFKNFTVVGGIWNNFESAQDDPFVGAWNECDFFLSLSTTVFNSINLTLTYSPWYSPPHAFHTEQNLDLKVGYDDSKMWGKSGFSLNPYVDFWWAISGDSTVILGKKGNTGYIEPGIVPTYTVQSIPGYPLTLTFPMYVQVGPDSYWDASGTFSNQNIGLFSVSANATMPLTFIPVRYGHWHADLGVTYDYLINNALLHAGTIASGNTNHNVIIGSLGFGVNF